MRDGAYSDLELLKTGKNQEDALEHLESLGTAARELDSQIERRLKATQSVIRNNEDKLKQAKFHHSGIHAKFNQSEMTFQQKFNEMVERNADRIAQMESVFEGQSQSLEIENRLQKDHLCQLEEDLAVLRRQLKDLLKENQRAHEITQAFNTLSKENNELKLNLQRALQKNQHLEKDQSTQLDFLAKDIEKKANERIRKIHEELHKSKMETEVLRHQAERIFQNLQLEIDELKNKNSRLSNSLNRVEKENLSLRESLRKTNEQFNKEKSDLEFKLISAEQRRFETVQKPSPQMATPSAHGQISDPTHFDEPQLLEIRALQQLQEKLDAEKKNSLKIRSDIISALEKKAQPHAAVIDFNNHPLKSSP